MSSSFKWFSHYQFFYTLNEGWYKMNQEWFWGKNFQPEKIVLSVDDFDAFVERLNEGPKYNENLRKLLNRPTPWDNND
jgi:hypothetical protein